MGVGKIKKQILEETGVLYTEEEIKILKQESSEKGLDVIDYLKSLNDNSSQQIINLFNSFQNIDYFDWEKEETRKVVSLIYTSKLGYISREIRSHLHFQGEDVHNIYMVTSKLFFSVIKEIKDNNLFWVVFGWFYQNYELSTLRLQEFYDCITEERLKVNFYNRSILSNICWNVNRRLIKGYEGKDYKIGSIEQHQQRIMDLQRDTEQFHLQLYDKDFTDIVELGNDEEVKLYRGFKIDIKDKDMRIMDKENNKQLNGYGMSYSIHKEKCYYFGFRNTYFETLIKLFRQVMETDDNDKLSQNSLYETLVSKGYNHKLFFTDKKFRDDFLQSNLVKHFNEITKKTRFKNGTFDNILNFKEIEDYNYDTRGYVGEYTCKKKDILFWSDYGLEKECVVNHKDVKMLNYQVITMEQIKHELKKHKNFYKNSQIV